MVGPGAAHQRCSQRFAREGFVALAPDLYHGQAADEPDEARKLAMALDAGRAAIISQKSKPLCRRHGRAALYSGTAF